MFEHWAVGIQKNCIQFTFIVEVLAARLGHRLSFLNKNTETFKTRIDSNFEGAMEVFSRQTRVNKLAIK